MKVASANAGSKLNYRMCLPVVVISANDWSEGGIVWDIFRRLMGKRGVVAGFAKNGMRLRRTQREFTQILCFDSKSDGSGDSRLSHF